MIKNVSCNSLRPQVLPQISCEICLYKRVACVIGGLASRVKRNDTMARRLEKQEKQQQQREDGQENYDGMSWSSREQWVSVRNKIGTALTR